MTNKTPKDFKCGQVYKMDVADRSHISKPYYVQIIEVEDSYIKTWIPNKHDLVISYPGEQWDYHVPRMTLIGSGKEDQELVYGQLGLMPE